MLCRTDPGRAGRGRRAVWWSAALGLVIASPCGAQIIPERAYYGVNQPVPVLLSCPESGNVPEVRLYEPGATSPLDSASAAPGRIDLASMFPLLWTTRKPRVLYAQLHFGDSALGPSLVLQPMLTPAAALDGFLGSVLRAIEDGRTAELTRLLNSPDSEREPLRRRTLTTPPSQPVYAGLRVWVDRHVILETSAGAIEIRMRPDKAPNTVAHFLSLVEGGYYTGVPFHRVVAADALGRPFIVQAGDPTGLGGGGPGFHVDFEPSELAHDLGVVSLARKPDDPNSGGGQFFICLGREACRALDGNYAAFGELVGGGQALKAITAAPLAPIDPAAPGSPLERPIEPVVINSARLAPAPPYGTGPGRITPKDLLPPDR